MRKLFKLAFTLAEVLIVIGILGIVAEMTIPTLISSTDKQVETTQLKKFYSVFAEGMKTYMANEGCNDLACTGLFEGKRQDATWEAKVDADIRKTFKIVKSCDSYTTGCNKPLVSLSKAPATDSFYYGHSFITADGFLFMIYDTQSSNCQNNIVADPSAKLSGNCGTVYVDINGPKRPDTWGRDIFNFYIANDGSIFPNSGAEVAKLGGTLWSTNPADCGSPGSSSIPAVASGGGCSARIMEEAWKMNY